MRIISKHQDYYDGIGQYSPEPVWVRKEEKTTTTKLSEYGIDKATIDKLNSVYRSVPTPARTSSDFMAHALVGFCGRLQVVYYKNTYLGRPQDIISADKPSMFVEKFNKDCKHKNDHIYLDDDSVFRYQSEDFTDKGFRKWANKYPFDVSDVHRTIKSPIFLIQGIRGEYEFIINPSLKAVGFQAVINPWDTFMELERFISNDMVDCPLDNFVMSDELKRDSKGMDEWSFKQRGPKARKAKKK